MYRISYTFGMGKTFTQWCSEKRGRKADLAKHFNLTRGAVSGWGDCVPVHLMYEVSKLTNGEVTLEQMLSSRLLTKEVSDA